MFVQVKLLQGFSKLLTYKIPTNWNNTNLKGSIITVPLKNKTVPALVLKTFANQPMDTTFTIKQAIAKDHLPNDIYYNHFIKKISRFYFVNETHFYQRIKHFIYKNRTSISKNQQFYTQKKESNYKTQKVILTKEQQNIFDYINPFIKKPRYSPGLIHGVTNSGKTEIYKKLIIESLTQNKFALLLLPEVSLCLQFQHLLKKQLQNYNISILSFHSASKAQEKKELWQNLIEQKPCLIIGVHLPIILPIPNLGLIIVDEEHEVGFQEKKHPKINSKEIALWRAQIYNIPIILGSATPSLNSLYNTKKHNWKLFKLTKRFSGNFPQIQKVLLTSKQKRTSFWVTKELENAITDRLNKKEQVLIYLNRRGYSFFVQCKKCGFTFLCPYCSVSLTLHKINNKHELRCHYCNYKQPNPTTCPKCKTSEENLLKRGLGTQQVVSILQNLFPTAKIARADLDTTRKKQAWSQTVEQFEKRDIDILVGTQTITKGYHFPNVTLVGILWADLNVNLPLFNTNETTLQQLIQVSGRAGRQNKQSLVIVQMIHQSPIFDFLQEQNYSKFYETEMSFRKETEYPPFGRLVQIELKNKNPLEIEQDAQRLSKKLFDANDKQQLNITIMGPTRPLVYRIQKFEMRHIFLKSPSFKKIYSLINNINRETYKSQIFIVPTP